jgi:4-amino-4-deoxy-L-arabinose transferase-like glycosyltransferase
MIPEKKDRIAVILTVFFLLLYISSLSTSLDDEDSIHFALGLEDFNVTKYQPHPPGFPVYMSIGIAVNSFLQNGLLSLTLMSALFGAGSFLVFYTIVREMFDMNVAILSSVIMAVTPLFWLNSIKAMSDIMGLFFILISMLFIYKHIKHSYSPHLYIGAVLAGISIGVRMHSGLILIPILVYAMIKRNDMKTCLKTVFIFIMALLVWLIPLLIVTGAPEYISVTGDQLAYRIDKPDISLISSDVSYDDFTYRAVGFAYFFLLGGYGINVYGPGILSGLLIFLMITLFVVFVKRYIAIGSIGDNRFISFLLITVPYVFVIFFIVPPFNPRYLLILIPLLSLIFVLAIQNLRWIRIRKLVYLGLVFLLFSHSVLFAFIALSTPSPPVQMINYVNQNYGAGDYILLDGFALKYFIYYHTELTMLSNEGATCDSIKNIISSGKTVITNSLVNDCVGLRAKLINEFQREPRVHIKRSKVSLYQFILE